MTSDDLQQFIDANNIQASILSLDQHTPTVPEAAQALGVGTHQIIKSLVFRINDEPLLVIANGESRIDRRKVANYLGVGRGRVKFADAGQALELSGYAVGSMPPFGHKSKLRTVIDESVTKEETVFGGGGDINAMMRMATSELLRVSAGEVASVSVTGSV